MKDTFCPKCRTHLILNEELENSKSIKCPTCKTTFENPHILKKEIKRPIFERDNSTQGTGKQNPLTKRQINWIIAGVVVLLVWAFGGFEPSDGPKVKNSSLDASVHQVETFLKKNLNDPDSYESIEWSALNESKNSWHKYWVRHKYRAKNGYGGYVIENQIFYLDEEGHVLDYKDVSY